MITFTGWNVIPNDFEGRCYIEISKAECWLRKERILHRLDGPACIEDNGNIQWFYNDQLHRLDGPAGTYPNKSNNTGLILHYAIFGEGYTEEYYWNHPLVVNHPPNILKKLKTIIEL